MINYLLPILAVVLGFLLVAFTQEKKIQHAKLLLSFSGAFLLALTLFDLLPEVYEHLNARSTGGFIMCGILIQIILEFFSKGAEHGHVHIHKHDTSFPWALFISLCIHSFLEGFPIHHHNDMVYGILVHKIPIAMLITTFLYQSHYNKVQIFAFLALFTMMTPLGTLISNNTDIATHYLYYINAIVIGIFLHISTTILFESSEGHKFNLTKLLTIILGVIVAYLI
ncbi:ZIP family metal transporter [Mangrovimonas aestuarii]|uniref:ZIP family metal transporter n=1 Tax=Mangrovimonas aestuarii TaxID=3018443 RepID=UPI002378C311|nr:ZIP family metal transporter [Mangrovimonas aestuarii]